MVLEKMETAERIFSYVFVKFPRIELRLPRLSAPLINEGNDAKKSEYRADGILGPNLCT